MKNVTNATSPKDFFLHVFAAGSLYLSAITLVTLLWQLVNVWLPEDRGFYETDSVTSLLRWSVSFLLVAFPAYVVAMRWIGNDLDRHPEKSELWVRRWSLYGTLFLAAVTLLGDLAFLVYAFLGGDVALRFALKALSIVLVAGGILGYHWFLLRREPGTGRMTRTVVTAGASILVIAAIVIGFVAVGTPGDARAERNDRERVSELQALQWQVNGFYELKQRLPEDSGELLDPAAPASLPTDPVTGEPYGYERLGELRYQLCATFERASELTDAQREDYAASSEASGELFDHQAGRQCFERTIDSERFGSDIRLPR